MQSSDLNELIVVTPREVIETVNRLLVVLSSVRITSTKRMYHALEVDEILLNIFAHCNSPRFKHSHGRPWGVAIDLVALARTCRIFKEPALDVLWSELSDLCPLAQCLPEVS